MYYKKYCKHCEERTNFTKIKSEYGDYACSECGAIKDK